MLAAKFLNSQLRQTVKPTTCRALIHTDNQNSEHPKPAGSSTKRTKDVLKDENQLELANVYFQKFPNYCQMITDAKQIAKRSVLIDHCGTEHIDLKTNFSNIEQVYNIEKETNRGKSRLSLIEFKQEEDAEKVAKQARHNEGLLPVPLKVFRYIGNKDKPPIEQQLNCPIENVKLSFKRESSLNFDRYTQLLCNNMMSLIALKLRFITLVNFERILCSGMFEEYELSPYGSSVIDLGSDTGDLDLVVTRKEEYQYHNHNHIADSKIKSNLFSPTNSNSKLVHIDKSLFSETADKSGIKGTMRWFDQILREYHPLSDSYNVLFVRHARVPIIKFTSRITNIECDLSFNLGLDYRERESMKPNTLMAQILYNLCRNNNLFTALSIYLKIFAKLTNITSKEPNLGLKNFQYLSLIMFYLQQTSITKTSHKIYIRSPRRRPSNSEANSNESTSDDHIVIVPPFSTMLNLGDKPLKENLVYSSEEIDKLLGELVIGFFEFYSNFDFSSNSLNLFDGKIERKLDNSSIYVQNPLERSHNICHNVNRKGMETFVKEIRLALSGIRQGYNYKCPLSLIRYLMIKNQQMTLNAKKTKQLKFTADGVHLESQPQRLFHRIGDDGVAQDVCR